MGELRQTTRSYMEETIKLNLGCGIKLLDGFINVDCHYEFDDPRYLRADVRDLPFEDNSADYILARQVLEHIQTKDILNTLKEWLRVLKPSGRMVVTCPDFNQLAEEWLNTDFTPEIYYELAQGIYGNQLTDKEYHLSPITPQFLKYCLSQLGQDAVINVYPPNHEMIHYPGIEKEKRFYRYGEVHIDLKK